MKRSQKFLMIMALLGSIAPFPARAQDTVAHDAIVDTIETNLDLFAADEPMVITLTFDLKQYQRTKMKGEYMPAHLSYYINDSMTIDHNIRIKARGEFRRSFCLYAPFWLNIRKAKVKTTQLQDIKRMKVVTQCRGSNNFGDYVLKEYLAYRIYQILSPESFRTRLVRMKYVDTGRKNKVTETWAFILEPEEMLAERVNGRIIESDRLSMRMMEHQSMDLVAIFAYMIGNSDFSITGQHNVKVLSLARNAAEGYTPVPYDFDYSGIVNAEYAVPGENLGISSVTERFFLGPCRENIVYRQTMEYILEHREKIIDEVSSFPYLDDKEKEEMIAYLNQYFRQTEKPGLENTFKNTCR